MRVQVEEIHRAVRQSTLVTIPPAASASIPGMQINPQNFYVLEKRYV